MNESTIIDDTIKVIVLNNKHVQVKIGVEAPEDVEILWEEIYEKMEALEGSA